MRREVKKINIAMKGYVENAIMAVIHINKTMMIMAVR